jgi:hypothetical protein
VGAIAVAPHDGCVSDVVFGARHSQAYSGHVPMSASRFSTALSHDCVGAGVEERSDQLAPNEEVLDVFPPIPSLREPGPGTWVDHLGSGNGPEAIRPVG